MERVSKTALMKKQRAFTSTPLGTKKNVKALILRAAGTNCDQETIHALKLAGAQAERVHVNQLLTGRVRIHPYDMLVIPGGFSYGDDISAGKVLAMELKIRLRDQLVRFVQCRKLVLGVCNGFQVLVKTGLLPGFDVLDENQTATLAMNDSGRFQCQWVGLKTEKSAAAWLEGVPKTFELPIAHGEGKFVTLNSKILERLKKNRQIVFSYYSQNPNGSQLNIAGLCNPMGNVVGLMPHPERFVSWHQHPHWPERSVAKAEWGDGFWFWKSAVSYAQNILN